MSSKNWISFLITCIPLCGFSQDQKWITEINQQVWKPFVKSFIERDDSTNRSLHSKDFIRVGLDDKSVYGLEQYSPKLSESEKKRRANWQSHIELRFIERIVSEDKAFESGYYKSSFKNIQTNETRTNLAKFIVLLRKEAGVWKILVDADGKEGTTEEMFQNAQHVDSIRFYKQDSQGEKNKIAQLQSKFSENYLNGDFAAISKTYSDSAILMAPATDIIIGRTNIYSYWSNLPKTKLVSHKSLPEKIILKGNEAWEYGYYFVQSKKSDGSLNPIYSAKYFIIWTKESGEWKIKMDMWNSRNSN
jgi:ketosteroid isomerase-like protein